MTSAQLQAAIVENLRRQIPKHQNLADTLASVLNLGKNAAYKRIEGSTPFTMDDLAAIAAHFDLSWKQIFQPEKPLLEVEFSGLAAPGSCLEYLQILERDMLALRASPAPQVHYVTTGLPDFHYFYFEELTLFNCFIWERMVWNRPEWQQRPFSLADYPGRETLLPLAKRLANHYAFIPVVEIWNEYVLENFLRQAAYVAESRLFENKEDLLLLCRRMQDLASHLALMAQSGRRFPPGGNAAEATAPFRLFYHETMQNNILMLVETGESEWVYSVLDNPNFLKTNDPELVRHARSLFDKLLTRTLPLSEGGERYRSRFFKKLDHRIELYERKILASAEEWGADVTTMGAYSIL